MATKTKAPTVNESSANPLFTHPLRTLHDTAAWVGERCPDLIPAGVPALAYVNPSWLAMALTEYGRRLRSEFGAARGFDRLEPHIEALPAKVMTWNPNAQEIGAHCDAIDRAVDKVRNPPAPEPLPEAWLKMAACLGITLPKAESAHDQITVRQRAIELLHTAIATNTPDKTTPVWMAFRPRALDLAPHPMSVRRAVHALAADHLLPSGFRELFPATDEELRRLSPITPTPVVAVVTHAIGDAWVINIQGGKPPEGYSDLVRELGERVPLLQNRWNGAFRDELDALDRKRREQGFVIDEDREHWLRELNERRYREEVDRARATGPAISAARTGAAEWHQQYEDQRARVMAAFDAALAAMPIGVAWYYAHEVREQVATGGNVSATHVKEMSKAGVRVELKP